MPGEERAGEHNKPLNALLSPREKEIVKLIATGMSNKEIANKLRLSDNTIKTHLGNIYKKLDVNDRTSAAVLALRDGLIK